MYILEPMSAEPISSLKYESAAVHRPEVQGVW